LWCRKLFDHDHAYIFQNPDKRIIFGIPFEDDFTLIGTTDVEHRGSIGDAHIETGEIAYLCEQASRYFEKPIVPSDVVWSFSGVRPLLEDGAGNAAAVTRDYFLDLDTKQAPLLTVWGGKLTAFRKLAEEVTDMMVGPLGCRKGAWTASASLPGGDLSAWIGPAQRPDTDFERFAKALVQRHPQMSASVLRRLARGYGARVDLVLGTGALGAEVAPGLFEAELHYLQAQEWACTADDVLWRRTKLGLHYDASQRAAVQAWCQRHWNDGPPAQGGAWS
jgi:glycerol-3-phosphate dehydrogenase